MSLTPPTLKEKERAGSGMTERGGCKLGPYVYAADAPNHSVDTDVYGILQPRG
jgi:hypothetical protein